MHSRARLHTTTCVSVVRRRRRCWTTSRWTCGRFSGQSRSAAAIRPPPPPGALSALAQCPSVQGRHVQSVVKCAKCGAAQCADHGRGCPSVWCLHPASQRQTSCMPCRQWRAVLRDLRPDTDTSKGSLVQTLVKHSLQIWCHFQLLPSNEHRALGAGSGGRCCGNCGRTRTPAGAPWCRRC